MTTDPHQFVEVLEAEQSELDALLTGLEPSLWDVPTPSTGWSVRDQVSHLADTEAIARDTVTGGPRSLANETARLGNAVIDDGVDRGRVLPVPDVLTWWRTAAAENCRALRSADVAVRLPWGLGMSWRSFVTARLMEHWAHGLDIRAAVGSPSAETGRLEHIAHLAYGSIPYALKVARMTPPPGRTLRLELLGPDGQRWSFGQENATDLISGPAGLWCRRAVQRIRPDEASNLNVDGPLAELVVQHARAYL